MQTPTGGGMMSQSPLGVGKWLQTLAYALSKPREIAVVGEREGTDTQALLNVVRDGYLPFQVVALGAPTTEPPGVPLLQDRGLLDERAAAYVCRAFTCQSPVADSEDLRVRLERNR
jgi:uncharacterized protein YyaL (SSP411 family)